MPEAREPNSRERSVSGEFDSDFESHAGDTLNLNPPGKPGRKKNPNSQAARRDQNRIAQREFRLRKQQRIRDLEARVEILSGGKDEALGEMRNMLNDLMAENQTLRNLIRSLGSFIGDGVGGLLPKIGWDISSFNSFIDRSETDTAWEGYQRRKKQTGDVESTVSQGHKRSADDEASNTNAKKARPGDNNDGERTQNGFPLLVPMNTVPLSASGMYAGESRPQDGNIMFSELIRGTSSTGMFMQQPSTSTNPSVQYGGSNVSSYQSSYIPGVNMNIEPSLGALPYNTSTSPVQQRVQQTRQLSEEPIQEDDEPNKNEAYKLIHYHLDNYRRNNAYCLPSSLRPTPVQRTVPHKDLIDRILHPELRDQLILCRDQYDLADCLIEYRHSLAIHGDDVLAHNNWEIGEKFLRQFSFLIDQATLNISNRWRRERGEPELSLNDLNNAKPPA